MNGTKQFPITRRMVWEAWNRALVPVPGRLNRRSRMTGDCQVRF